MTEALTGSFLHLNQLAGPGPGTHVAHVATSQVSMLVLPSTMISARYERYEASHGTEVQQHRAVLAAQLSYWQDTFNRSQSALERQRLHQRPGDAAYTGSVASWFQWEPTYACPVSELVGTYGDGVKWVCGVRDIAPPCVVYSMGSGSSAQFERSMLKQTLCEIHIFDPTTRASDVPADLEGSRIQIHRIGLGGSDEVANLKFNRSLRRYQLLTIGSIMRMLNHSFVDVLKIDIEGKEGPVVAGFGLPNEAAPLPIGQLLIEVHSNRLPGGGRGPGRQRLFDRLSEHNFHVFHKEINVLSTSSCEYAWTRVAMRCVRSRPAEAPRLMPVSFPWARLLPESCEGYRKFWSEVHATPRRLSMRISARQTPRVQSNTAGAGPPAVNLDIPEEAAPAWWAAVKQEDENHTNGEAGDGGALAFPPFRDAMDACGDEFLEYAMAHNAATGIKSPEWLLKRRRLEKVAPLSGVLLIEPQHGGMGNSLRILSQYALLGVMLRRLVCFRLGNEMHAMVVPFVRSPLLDWTCPGVIAANATRHEMVISKSGTLPFYLNLFSKVDVRKHFAGVDILHIRADSSAVTQQLIGNPHLVPHRTKETEARLPACIRQLFFQPTRRTLTALTPYLEELHFPQPYVAAHLRMGDMHMEHVKQVLHLDTEGAQAAIQSKDERVRPRHVNYVLRCFDTWRNRTAAPGQNVTIFVATDSSDLLPAIKAKFGSSVVFVPGFAVHTGNWVTRANKNAVSITTVVSMQKVWLDFLLLSLQQLGIISGGGRLSSFTSEAYARARYVKRQSQVHRMWKCR